jgi:hypothetical protein
LSKARLRPLFRPYLPTMSQKKLKVIFADFLKAARALWLECIGGIFLGLGILFGVAAIQEYRKYVNSPETGAGRLLLVIFSAAVMFFFALESFWKARKPR